MASPDEAIDLSATVDKTLIEKRRLLGIDRRFAAVLVVTGIIIIAATKNPWLIGGLPIVYLGIWLFTRNDPDLYDVYMRYRKQGDHYEPRAHASQARNLRPEGFGRGFPCF